MKKLNKKQKRQIAAIAAKKDADIDLSDMPEVLDWSKAEIGKFYRPTKKTVTVRLDTDIITWLKSYGRESDQDQHAMRHAMKSSVRAKARQSSTTSRTRFIRVSSLLAWVWQARRAGTVAT